MIPEYAIEPEAIGEKWENFRNLIDKFGFDRGRLISKIPRKWEHKVINAAKEAGIKDVHIASMIQRLTNIKDALVETGRPYDSDLNWLDNAIIDHERKPFQAIIVKNKESNTSEIIPIEEVNEDHPQMTAFRDNRVIREPATLLKAFEPLLKYSSRILFIDPYFDPFSQKYQNTFIKIFEYLKNENSTCECEIHYRFHKSKPDPEQIEREWAQIYFRLMPPEIRAKLYCWKIREKGEDFHARYLLTEKGGMTVEAGFSSEGASQRTLVQLMSNKLVTDILSNFRIDSDTYEFISPVIEIDGNGHTRRL